jgi:hypothetical protein
MALTDRDSGIIKLLALVVQVERASDKRFIFDRQFAEFVSNLTDEEKEIVNMFYEEQQRSDLIALALDNWIDIK